jgi:HAD superfamily hydrolase (TIGR01509 family)
MIKAIIFDMDGLMINSEPIQSKAYEEILKEYGKKPILNNEGIVHKVGIKEKDNWKLLCETYNLDESIDVLMQKRSKAYLKLLINIEPMNGLMDLLNLLKSNKFKIALASSSIRKHINVVLSKLNIEHFFDAVVSGQDVEKGKPHPDINLKAAKMIQVNPENCLVLEDAQSGVEAAKNGNMKVIAIPNKFTLSHDLSKADLILESLEKINLDIINQL